MNIIFAMLLGVILAWPSLGNSAQLVTFYSKTAFVAATGATSATGPLPDLGLIPGGAAASQTVGSVTFSLAPPSSELYIGVKDAQYRGAPPDDWTARLPGPDIAISDIENLNADLATPVFSLGFDFVKPENDPNVNAGFTNSTFQVTLKKDTDIVGTFTFNAPSDTIPVDTAAFVGVWSDTAFNRVEIREVIGGIDNEFFGQFYAGTVPYTFTNKVIREIQYLQDQIAALDSGVYKGPNMKDALLNKLNAITTKIYMNDYQGALDQLQQDILHKTDGCATSGAPDDNDWVTNCEAQQKIYPWVMAIIAELRGALGQE